MYNALLFSCESDSSQNYYHFMDAMVYRRSKIKRDHIMH